MNGRTMKYLLSIAAVALAVSTAVAQPAKTADDYYKDGEKQYNLGNFDKAIENFKQAYAIQTSTTSRRPTGSCATARTRCSSTSGSCRSRRTTR
jgi:outer membrane protein assembly factor BamD (BamD/ComL family)